MIQRLLEIALLADLAVFVMFCPYYKILPKLFLGIAVVLWVGLMVAQFKREWYKHVLPKTVLNIPFALFILAAVVSIVFGLKPAYSQKILFNRYLLYAGFLLIGAVVVRRGAFNVVVVLLSVLVSSFIFGLGGVVDAVRLHQPRLFTVFGLTIPFQMFGIYLIYFIPFNLGVLMFHRDKFFRWFSGINLALLLVCWLAQASRSAWGVIIAVVFLILFFKKKKMVSIVFSLVLGSLLLLPQYRLRFETILHPDKWGERWAWWDVAVQIIRDHPVTGAGLGMYEKLMYVYKPIFSKWIDPPLHLHAHNTYLEITAEMGCIGLAAFLYIFFVFFKETAGIAVGTRNRSLDRNLLAIMCGVFWSVVATLLFALTGTIITVGVSEPAMFWFMAGLAVGVVGIFKQSDAISVK